MDVRTNGDGTRIAEETDEISGLILVRIGILLLSKLRKHGSRSRPSA